MDWFLFILFAVLATLSALGVVVMKDAVKSAMSLIVTFFSLGALFVLQHAEIIGVLEVLVYAGAIMVLFVFVIMLVGEREEQIIAPGDLSKLGVVIKGGLAALVAYVFFAGISALLAPQAPELPEGFGSAQAIGQAFFDRFLFHFEMTSVLLLVGIVSAVVVSKQVRRTDRG